MKILVGYDSSETAQKALKIATMKAQKSDAYLYVVTSLSKGTQSQLQKIQEKEKELDIIKEMIQGQNVSCDTVLLIRGANPGVDLVEFAKENNADEIFVGVKKRSKVGKMILGSTAQYVILNAHCPVVTVK